MIIFLKNVIDLWLYLCYYQIMFCVIFWMWEEENFYMIDRKYSYDNFVNPPRQYGEVSFWGYTHIFCSLWGEKPRSGGKRTCWTRRLGRVGITQQLFGRSCLWKDCLHFKSRWRTNYSRLGRGLVLLRGLGKRKVCGYQAYSGMDFWYYRICGKRWKQAQNRGL